MQLLGEISDELLEFLKQPELVISDPNVEILSIVSNQATDSLNLHQTCKRITIKIKDDNRSLVVKYFFPQSFRRRLYYSYFRRDPLLNAYLTQQQLSKGTTINSAKTHCWYKETGFPYSFVVSDYLQNHFTIVEHLKRNYQAKAKLIHWLAKEIAEMHNQGFFHPDIKPSNIFVNASGSLVWIDLDRAMCRQALPINQRINNLYYIIRYFVFALDWNYALPFLQSYCAHSNAKINCAEILFSEVLKLHFNQTRVETKRQARRFADGYLDKEDFCIC